MGYALFISGKHAQGWTALDQGWEQPSLNEEQLYRLSPSSASDSTSACETSPFTSVGELSRTSALPATAVEGYLQCDASSLTEEPVVPTGDDKFSDVVTQTSSSLDLPRSSQPQVPLSIDPTWSSTTGGTKPPGAIKAPKNTTSSRKAKTLIVRAAPKPPKNRKTWEVDEKEDLKAFLRSRGILRYRDLKLLDLEALTDDYNAIREAKHQCTRLPRGLRKVAKEVLEL